MSRRISTKAAEAARRPESPPPTRSRPRFLPQRRLKEHHTVVEPEIIEPEILPKQASGKTAAHKAAKPVDVTDAEDEDSEDIGDDLPEDDVAALDPDADILPEGDTLPAPSQQHLPSLSSSKDSLHLYLREVSRFPMLKPDEEFDLARRVQKTGDSDAAFRLVSSHLRLVVKIAMDFQRRWMQNVLDLIQEGNVGLMRAVNKFDPDKGIKFSYYAAFWIRAYILKFIMDNWRMVKIGTTQAQRKLFYNLNRERQKLIAEGFDPDAAVLAERASAWADQIVEMQQRLDASDMSLDATVGDESGSATRMDFLPALGPGIEESLAGMEIAELLQSKIRDILPSLFRKKGGLHPRAPPPDRRSGHAAGNRGSATTSPANRVRQLERACSKTEDPSLHRYSGLLRRLDLALGGKTTFRMHNLRLLFVPFRVFVIPVIVFQPPEFAHELPHSPHSSRGPLAASRHPTPAGESPAAARVLSAICCAGWSAPCWPCRCSPGAPAVRRRDPCNGTSRPRLSVPTRPFCSTSPSAATTRKASLKP